MIAAVGATVSEAEHITKLPLKKLHALDLVPTSEGIVGPLVRVFFFFFEPFDLVHISLLS